MPFCKCYCHYFFLAPSFWHCLEGNAMCISKRQSPVDIKTKDVVKNNRIVPFDFSDLEDTERVKMEMRNNGHAGKHIP